MGFSLNKIFKGAAIAATGFVASKYLGPTAGKLATRAVGSLMGNGGGGSGGDWKPTDNSITAPTFGGRIARDTADTAGTNSSIKTADANQLKDEWDYRLSKWFKNKDEMFG